ncbi:putative disease resistance RPP13-like protein 1 [Capsicum chacoense]
MTRLWNANGLLQHPQCDKAIEDVGNQYFAELRVRFFFKRIGNNKFLMHDLVNDLAQCVSSKFCARLENNWQNYTPERVRHVSCLKADYDVFEKFKTLKDAKHLRTLVPLQKGAGMYYYWLLGNKFVQGLLPFLSSLRVLSLSKHRGITELPPSVIGNLKHLRLLDLSSTEILKLPGSVSTLYNLQMLLLSGCAYLNELPKELVGKGKGLRIQDLGELQHLRGYLHISGLENVVNGRDAASANLKDKKLNENLVMEWSDSHVEDSFSVRDTLDKLQPHMGLKSLKLSHFGGTRFPDLLGDDSFVNLKTLHLESCNCCFLPALGQLSSMKFLTISKMDEIRNVGEEFYGYNAVIRPFQSLIFLKFEQMMAWELWKILDNGVFSSFEELHISKCPQQTGDFPSELLSLNSLKPSF